MDSTGLLRAPNISSSSSDSLSSNASSRLPKSKSPGESTRTAGRDMSFDDDEGGEDSSSRSNMDVGFDACGRDFDCDDVLEAGAPKSSRPQPSP